MVHDSLIKTDQVSTKNIYLFGHRIANLKSKPDVLIFTLNGLETSIATSDLHILTLHRLETSKATSDLFMLTLSPLETSKAISNLLLI
jgi:hypothetical protein